MSNYKKLVDNMMDTRIAEVFLKQIDMRGWVNKWINDHKGKVPNNFIPFDDVNAFFTSEMKKNKGFAPLPENQQYMEIMSKVFMFTVYCQNLTKVEIQIERKVLGQLYGDNTFYVPKQVPMILKEDTVFEHTTKIPMEVLGRVPYWSVRVPIINIFDNPMMEDALKPGSGVDADAIIDKIKIDMIFADFIMTRTSIDGDDCVIFNIRGLSPRSTLAMEHVRVVSLGAETLEEGLRRHAELNNALLTRTGSHELQEAISAYGDALLRMALPVAVYIGSQQKQQDIGEPQSTGYTVKRKGKNFVLRSAPRKRIVRYGEELKEQLEAFESEVARAESKGRAPHIRKAHWHGYWTGPRAGVRKYIYHWIPPTIISGTNNENDKG